MNGPDKIVLEHAGALGDFLLAWPALVSVARHFAGRPVHAAVRPAHAHWLSPLATPCPPELRRALETRFAGDTWPGELEGVLVVRPGLARRPDIPSSPFFWFLRGLDPNRPVSPRELYRDALAARGVPCLADPAGLFRGLFGSQAPVGRTVLLFPGAGHLDKAWPLDRLETLAEGISRRGGEPVFVLGPAEAERGIAPTAGTVLRPASLEELSLAIRTARCVVGPDSGPMHLAALHGVPGVALFGPTSPRQWGPEGIAILTAGLACAPCTAMTSGQFAQACPRPLPCLAGITVEAVMRSLEPWLEAI
jgi:ADP-heptose:LPS heptosyltransferase